MKRIFLFFALTVPFFCARSDDSMCEGGCHIGTGLPALVGEFPLGDGLTEFDFNGDGQNELVVFTPMGGSGGPVFEVAARSPEGQWKLIGDDFFGWPMLCEKTNGWYQIMTMSRGGGGHYLLQVHAFTGENYEAIRSEEIECYYMPGSFNCPSPPGHPAFSLIAEAITAIMCPPGGDEFCHVHRRSTPSIAFMATTATDDNLGKSHAYTISLKIEKPATPSWRIPNTALYLVENYSSAMPPALRAHTSENLRTRLTILAAVPDFERVESFTQQFFAALNSLILGGDPPISETRGCSFRLDVLSAVYTWSTHTATATFHTTMPHALPPGSVAGRVPGSSLFVSFSSTSPEPRLFPLFARLLRE